MCVRARARVCVRVCMHVCVRAYVRACVLTDRHWTETDMKVTTEQTCGTSGSSLTSKLKSVVCVLVHAYASEVMSHATYTFFE